MPTNEQNNPEQGEAVLTEAEQNAPLQAGEPEAANGAALPKEEEEYQRRRKVVSVVSIIVLVGVLVAAYFVIGKPLLATVKNPAEFQAWVNGHGVLGWLAMIGIMALQVIVAIIPGEPIELVAGYAFGAWGGMVLCLAGAVLGQLVIFFFVRKYGVKLVEALISREKLQSVKFLNDSRKLELVTFVLYLIPGTPKDALSYFAGLTPINMWRFLLLTGIARIPSVITSTVVGGALGDGNMKFAIIVFVATAVVSALCVLGYRLYSKSKGLDGGKNGKEASK